MEAATLTKLRIDETDIFLEDIGPSQGKITISGYNHNYSYYWGAMGGNLKDFICRINNDYFVDKLCGKTSTFDCKRTFSEVRKHIRTEIGLPWYLFLDFQKEMREQLNRFERDCEEMGENYFVEHFFDRFINRLDFYLIPSRERRYYEESFKGISEQWYFIQTRESDQSLWLNKLHNKLKKELKKNHILSSPS